VLGWNYASVVHTQTDYGTTAVFLGAAGAGLELRLSGAHTDRLRHHSYMFLGAAGAGLELRLCGAHTDRLRHHRLRRSRQEKNTDFPHSKLRIFCILITFIYR
jgi:hypothetical protein